MELLLTPKTGISRAEREARVRASYWLPYQWRWIQDEARNKIAEKSRRVGLTFAEEYRRVRRLAQKGSLYDAWVTSRDEALAKLFIQECRPFADMLKVAAEDKGETIIDKEKGVSAFTMAFATGRTLYSLSSNPDAQAGRKGDRTADEYALGKDQRKLFAIMKPGLKWGGQLSIFSTHRGVASYFNFLLKEISEKGNPKRFSHHRITIEDAVAQGLWIKIKSLLPDDDEQKNWSDDDFLQDCRNEMPDEASYLQEYMCVPEDDADSFLTWEMIIACSRALPGLSWRREPGPFFIGFDVGRKKDLSVITVMAKMGTQLVQVDELVMRKTPFSQQRAKLWDVLRLPTVGRCCIDATGLGMQLAEESVEEFGEHRVTAVNFSAAVKQELAYPMKTRFEDRSISIFDDRLLHADLRSVKTEVTKSGTPIFTTEQGASDGHADRFWSLALAVHAADTLTDPGVFARLRQFLNRGHDRSAGRRNRNFES